MKNRSRVLIMTAILLIGMAMWLPGLRSRRVAAQSPVLTGSYAYSQTALYAGGSTPAVQVGVVKFDGAGNLTGNGTYVQADPSPTAPTVQVQTGDFTGTYLVNPDGTGTVTIPGPNGLMNTIAFVITDGGSGVYFVQTAGSGNTVVTGTARKQ